MDLQSKVQQTSTNTCFVLFVNKSGRNSSKCHKVYFGREFKFDKIKKDTDKKLLVSTTLPDQLESNAFLQKNFNQQNLPNLEFVHEQNETYVCTCFYL